MAFFLRRRSVVSLRPAHLFTVSALALIFLLATAPGGRAAEEMMTAAEARQLRQTLVVLHEKYEALSKENFDLKAKLAKGTPRNETTSAGGSALDKKLADAADKLRQAIQTINQQNQQIVTLSEKISRLQKLNDTQTLTPVGLDGTTPAGSPSPVVDAYPQALLRYQQRQYDEAVTLLTQAPSLSDRAARLLAAAYLGQGNAQKAVDTLQHFMHDHPDFEEDLGMQRLLGQAYLRAKNPEQARLAFERALTIDTLGNYASALEQTGRLDEAEALLKLTIRQHPQHGILYYNLGTLELRRKNEGQAIDAFQRAAELGMNATKLHYQLGILYARRVLLKPAQASEADRQRAVQHLENLLSDHGAQMNEPEKQQVQRLLTQLRQVAVGS